jgi:hypothetical protein
LRNSLAKQISRILDEELVGRSIAIEQGVKDLSKFIKLPPNDFSAIDEKVRIVVFYIKVLQ